MDVIESVAVNTVAGEYRIDVLPDTYPAEPEFFECGLAYAGASYRSDYQNANGENAQAILELIKYHSAANQDIYDYERRSPAALARYVGLKYGYPYVAELTHDGYDRYRVTEPSADRFEPCDGLVWSPEDATDPAKYVAGMVSEYSAWATDDVYGYRVIDPSGDVIESVWGFFPDDTETPQSGEFWTSGLNYMYRDAITAVEYDVADRIRQCNLPTSGFIGLI